VALDVLRSLARLDEPDDSTAFADYRYKGRLRDEVHQH